MIALKTDAVWARFSKYGRLYPPYDNFKHMLRARDIARAEADSLGLNLDGLSAPPSIELLPLAAENPLQEPKDSTGV